MINSIKNTHVGVTKHCHYLIYILLLLSLSGCGVRCDIDEHRYVTFSNSFATAVSVEFQYRVSESDPYITFNETIGAGETKSIQIATIVHDRRGDQLFKVKVRCRQDSYDSETTNIRMSSASLSEYTFCQSSIEGNGIDILPIGSTCADQLR